MRRKTQQQMVPPGQVDLDATPLERLKLANQMAFEAAKEPAVRAVAVEALKGTRDIYKDGPARLARWVRKNIRYAMEAPGVEVLQGPFSTLAYRVGDCDDLAILWVALGRSVGLELEFDGVAYTDDPEVLVHAVGRDAKKGVQYELSKDYRWGGPLIQPLVFRCPDECYTLTWSPVDESYRITRENAMVRRFNPGKTGSVATSYDSKQDQPGFDWSQVGAGFGEGLSETLRRAPELLFGSDQPTQTDFPDEFAYQQETEAPSRVSPALILAGIGGAVALVVLLARG